MTREAVVSAAWGPLALGQARSGSTTVGVKQ